MSSNPATRIHATLSQIRRQKQDAKMRAVWASIFEIEAEDTGEILRLLSEFIRQISAAKDKILRVEGVRHDLYLRPLQRIESAFAQLNLNEQLKGFLTRLGPNTLESLDYTAEFLRERFPAGDLSKKQRDEILKSVEELSACVRDGDINSDLKAHLLEHLERLRRVLLEFELRGPEGLIDVLDMNLGFAVRAHTGQAKPPERKLLKRFGELLSQIYVIVSKATGLLELAGDSAEQLRQISGGGS